MTDLTGSASQNFSKYIKPTLICYSHLRWDFVFQRPQHLLSRAAKTYRVLFIEEPLHHDGSPQLDLSEREGGVTVVVPKLPHGASHADCVMMQRALMSRLLPAERARVAWYYSPMALAFSQGIPADVCVYDCMDELSNFKGAPPELREYERELMKRADLVFTGGQSLYEAKRALHPQVHAFPSSIDAQHFNAARARDYVPQPEDLAGIPRPRLGFFGVIDERMDLDLVERVARLRPDWQLVMMGPVVKIDPGSLPRLPNIHWLGSKQYRDLPRYLAHIDIGFMPFARNESTRFISPTKTPEYLAAGLPVISTAIRDVVRPYGQAGFVSIAGTAEEVVAGAEAIFDREPGDWLERVDRHLATMSWDRTWRAMDLLVQQAHAARQPARLVPAEAAALAGPRRAAQGAGPAR